MATARPGGLSRRDLLRLSGSLAALGLTGSLTRELIFAQPSGELEGVTIDYWNMVGVQNRAVRRLSESIIAAFEKRTGARVNTTWDSYGSIIGPKYRTNFKGGIRPTVMDATGRWTGQLRQYLRPLDDFMAEAWEPGARDGIRWVLPLVERQNRGYPDASSIYDLPFGLVPQAPVVTRRDHWERAGIDFEANWPIRDSDHFVEVLRRLRDGAGVRYPTEVYGKIWDAGDTQLNGWIRSLDLATSPFISEDWTRSNADSPAWRQAVQFYVDVFRKHELSSPNTPQSTDEDAIEQLIQGRKSIVHADILNRGIFVDRMKEELAQGLIQWAPHFPIAGGTTGSQVFLSTNTFHIVRQEGPDADLRERAAWEFIKEWFRPENQIAYAETAGLCAREDLWPHLAGAPDRYVEAATEMLRNDPGVWANHPRGVDIQYNLFAPHIQRALQGREVAAELKAYADKVNQALES